MMVLIKVKIICLFICMMPFNKVLAMAIDEESKDSDLDKTEDFYNIDDYPSYNEDDYETELSEEDDELLPGEDKRSALRGVVARRSQQLEKQKIDDFKNSIQNLEKFPAVLSDLTSFFKDLRHSIRSMKTPPKEKEPAQTVFRAADHSEKLFRPSATAAYLHALRSHRPSGLVRAFVSAPEPQRYKGTNYYDPGLMWTGLGKRRRR